MSRNVSAKGGGALWEISIHVCEEDCSPLGILLKKKALLIKFKRTVLIHSLLTSLVCQKRRHKAFSCNSYRRLSSNLKLNFLYCVVSFFLFVLTSSNLLQKSNLLTFVRNMFCRCTGQQQLLPLLGKFY